MRTVTKSTNNFTRKDLINSQSATAMKDADDENIRVVACAIIHDDGGGEEPAQDSFVLSCGEGVYYSGISAMTLRTCSDLIDIIDDEGPQNVKVRKGVSKGGRDFINLVII